MPLTKYQIRSEYSLADPDLYRNAERDDPEALLEGVAMAGLVGVLRQLGDLAEFAAEVFHDLHEEVMATASRGHGLMVRVQQLEAEFPSIEKAFLSQTDHSMFFCNAGVDWHPNMRIEQNVITRGDLPRCVMDSYEECRGPPRLFLLDKFDVAGAGACLKRYTDPSFFKIEAASSGIASLEIQREKKSRKVKKKGSRWRNGVTPEIAPTSHAKLHQLFLEERVENGYTDPACLVKLKRRQLSGLPLNTKSGKSYMEKFLQTPSPEHKTICERSITSQTLTLTSANSSESGFDIREISTVSAVKMSSQGRESTTSSPVQEMILKSSMEEFIGGVIDREIVKVPEPTADGETNEIPSDPYKKMTVEKELVIVGKRRTEDSLDGDLSEDLTSEVDNYMDALTTMESEMETDTEFRPKSEMGFLNVGQNGTDSDANEEQMQAVQFSDSQSIGNTSASDDGNNSFKRGRFSFSYSDTVSTSAENAPSDVEGTPNLFSSTAGMADASSNQLSNKEVIGYVSNEFESVSGRGIDKDGIPDIKVPGSCVVDSNPMHLPLGAGASSQLVSPVASELDEMPSDSIIKLDTDETGARLSDSAVVIVDAYSQTRDDIMFIASPESNPKDEFDSVHPNVSSNVSVNSLKLSDPTSREKSCACSVGEAIQTDFADDKCSQHLVNVEFSCMQSVIPPMEEQFPYTARPEVDVHLGMSSPDDGFDVSIPDEIVCEVNDPIPAAEINSGTTSLSTEVEGPIRGTQVVPEADDGSPVAELNLENTTLRSTEIGSTIQTTEEVSEFDDVIPAADDGTPLGTEVDHSIPAFEVSSDNKISVVDTSQICGLKDQQFLDMLHDVPEFESGVVEVGVPYSEQEANFEGMFRAPDGEEARELLCKDDAVEGGAVPLKVPANYPDNLGLDNQVDLDDIATKAACEEHGAVSIAADAGNDFNTAVSPSLNLSSPSKDSMNFQESLSGTGNPQKEGLEPNEALSSKYDVESEAEKEVNGLEVPPDLHIIPCESVCYDCSSQEVCDDIQDSSLADLTSHHIPFSNVTTAPTSVEGSNLESETQSPHQSHLLENSEDVMSSRSRYLRNPGVFLEQSLEAQVHQGKCLQADEESLNLSNVQPVQMQCPDHNSDQRYSHASSESCQPDFPSQPSSSRFLPQSLGKEVDSTNKAMNPLDPILPSPGLLPDANEVNLEEMPPLPPLPPMQWRMGKLLNVPPASLRDLVENSQASFSTVQPFAADNKAQFSSIASERGILQPGDPFLALKVREAESQNVPEQFLGNLMQPSPFQLQSPTMVCDADNQHNSVWLEGTQSVKPFLTLPAVSSERLEHVIPPPLEGDIVRSTSAPSSPVAAAEYTSHGNDLVSSQGKPTLTEDQAAPRTGLEDGPFQHISQNSGEHDHPSDTSVPPQRKFEDKPQLVQPGSDGGTEQSLSSVTPPVSSSTEREIVWPSNAFALAPTFEVGKESSNPRVKLPRPRSPLVDAVAAHDRSTLRKVSERVRPQLTRKVEERDSLLEQIRTKSFNLKPAAVTRPSIQGPKTNLRVAAILEKANAIRQATAGSDEDDDTDSWSDS